METITDLAWLLRQLRRRDARQRGDSALTYRELASKTGWSRAVIGAYFSGKILPPTDRLDVLIRLLGATPAEQGAIATLRDQVEENRRNRTAGSQDRDVNSRLFDVPGLVATPPQRIRDSLKPFAARRFTTLANLPAFHSAVPAAPHRLISHALSAAEARDLLVHRLGPRQALCEPHAVDEIIALCAGVPLALNIVAGHAAAETGCSLNRLAGELRDTRGELEVFDAGDGGLALRTVVAYAYRKLSIKAARLFRLLALHPGPDITTASAASLVGAPVQRVQALLAELAAAQLVAEHSPGRFALHDLLGASAAELAHSIDSEVDRCAAIHRMLDHYVHTARTAALLLHSTPPIQPITTCVPQPGVTTEKLTDRGHALAWFMAERAVLLAAVEMATDCGYNAHTRQLSWALAIFTDR